MGGVVCFTSDFSSVVARSHTVNRLLAIGYSRSAPYVIRRIATVTRRR
jgi:hypothetical protein